MADTWLRDVADTYLDFTKEAWDAMIDDHSMSKRNGNAFEDFLGPAYGKGTSLFLYVTSTTEQKSVQVKRKREVPIVETVDEIPVATVSVEEGVDAVAAEKAKIEGETKSEVASDSSLTEAGVAAADLSPENALAAQESKEKEAADASEGAVAAAIEKPKMRIIEETVTEIVTTTKVSLGASLLSLPSSVAGVVPAIFFVKTKDGAISPGGAGSDEDYMSENIECGAISADLLEGVETVVKNVFQPFLEPQLGGKSLSDTIGGGGGFDEEAAEKDGDATEHPPGSASKSAAGSMLSKSMRRPLDGTSTVVGGSGAGAGTVTGQSAVSGIDSGSAADGGIPIHVQRYFPDPVAVDKDLALVNDSIKGEFKSALTRYGTVVTQTIQQVSGDVRLNLPNVVITDPHASAADEELKGILIEAVESWTRVVISIIGKSSEKDKGTRPMQELEFWRDRNARLSSIFEAINTPNVKAMLDTLEIAKEPVLDPFKAAFSEMSKAYVECRDNVKFLNTLERHFKALATGSLAVTTESVPSLLNGLRMVWTVSRHYNTDDQMLPMMKRIVNEITDKVASEVNIKSILRQARVAPEEANATMKAALELLDSWKHNYMTVRERIEKTTDHRWEFDRRTLFERTDHMGLVINDIVRVVSVVSEFSKFFRGNELKAITTDPSALNAVLKLVDRLTLPLVRLNFSVYDKTKHNKWRNEMRLFDEKVADIERNTETFIAKAFSQLRSSDGAFELLAKLGTIQMRDSIRMLLESNMGNIVTKGRAELADTAQLFETQKANPPLNKNSPPVAGAIAWANALYMRRKKPIMKFRALPALFASKEGQLLKEEYLVFARSVDSYVRGYYSRWCTYARAAAADMLRAPILGPPLLKDALSPSLILNGDYDVLSPDGSKERGSIAASPALRRSDAAASSAVLTTPGLLGSDSEAARLAPPPYYVNYSRELSTLIREAKLLDQMGYAVPEAAMAAALQDDNLNDFVCSLQGVLDKYHEILSSLSAAETNLLQSQIAKLKASLRPGFTPLNWNSLHIASFISDVEKAMQDFESALGQTRKSCTMLEDTVTAIATTCLIDKSEFENRSAIEVNDIYEALEKTRSSRVDVLVRKYRSVRPVMKQVEGLIAGTDTLASPRLAEFYRYWERRFCNAITSMIISSLAVYEALLNAATPPPGAGSGPILRAPLSRVVATFSGGDVTLSPDLSHIGKMLRRAFTQIINSAKAFPRWLDGTCIEVEVSVPAIEEPPDFSYLPDIRQNPEIVNMLITLNPVIIQVFESVKRYTTNWSKYGASFGLWKAKTPDAEKKLIEKAPPAIFFDKRLSAYSSLADGVDAQPTFKDIGFLHVDCYPIAVAIKTRALSLKDDFGRILKEISRKRLEEFSEKLKAMHAELEVKPQDIDALKGVLGAVATALDSKVEMELVAAEIKERYETLESHGLKMGDEVVHGVDLESYSPEILRAKDSQKLWQAVVDAALTKDKRLVKVKEQFRAVTAADVKSFVSECDATRKDFLALGPTSGGISLMQGLTLLAEYREKLAKANSRREAYSQAERLFGLPITRYGQLSDIKDDMSKVAPLYDLYSEQVAFAESKSSMLWVDLDVSVLQKGADELQKRLAKLKDLKGTSVYNSVFEEVNGFRDSLPLISSLKNPSMKERHWDKISVLSNVKIVINPKTFTLGSIFAMKLDRFAEPIAEIVNEAKQEAKIEKDIKTIQDKWAATAFVVQKYMKGGEVRGQTLKASDDIKVELDDNLLNLQAMAGSRFISSFASTVSEWDKKLNIVAETMDVWMVVQTKWQYLEGIFQSEDIRQQLPDEAKKFGNVDKDFKGIMSATAKNPNVVDACCEAGRLEMLRTLGEKLDNCQKSLSEYLNTKRNAFARFFFISDDELLSVLGSSDPTSIRVHLLKLFDNVKDFAFVRGNRAVGGMTSSEGESFTCKEPSPVEGPVESWMTLAEAEMKSSLRAITKEGVFHYAHQPRLDWVRDQLGMVDCVGSQIWWTWETEDVFARVRKGDKHAMKVFAERQTRQLMDMVAKVRENIPKHHRAKVNTLLIIDVHGRDIIDSFVRDSILDAREFAWESQLRMYWEKDIDDVVIRQCTGQFRYGYEYMGLNGRLVITPLTDRCYMTLTQALTFNLGGAPAGPAGTGKTETTKDLAKNLTIPCFVINCGEGLDYKAMASTFSGLCQVGAWGCFDEFNRINIEVLSVVSAQVRTIMNALSYRRPTCDIGMGEIKVNTKVGIFITMNPGYAGRTELPDNLKALFRPVTMIVPDLLQICEIMLFSEGFEGARVLAKKMTTLYSLSKAQLSKQFHYDFALRALKSVLVMAGGLKREFLHLPEDLVLMRALRDNNMPKFVFDDVPLFLGLLADLFPGLDCPRVAYPVLKNAIQSELDKVDMHHDDEPTFQIQVDKVIQLYEIILTRHTTMLVGPTGGGKSVVLDILQKAMLPAFGKTVKKFTLNPKAQTVNEMYGVMDPATRDWQDGILSKIFRTNNEALPPGKEDEIRWIVFDGDVDAVWVENMNSVMDDNKLLTLPNGERIRLQPYVKLIIEVFDLQYASPATISRTGMTFIDPKNLGFRPYFVRWVKQRCLPSAAGARQRPTEGGFLQDLYEKYVPKLIAFVLEGDNGKRDESGAQTAESIEEPLSLVVPQSNMNLTKQLCAMLDAALGPATADGPELEDSEVAEGIFVFACLWSIGAAVVVKDRERFNQFITALSNGAAGGDGGSSLYECFYDAEAHRWAKWSTRVPTYEPPSPFEFSKVLVPTTDSVLYTHLLTRLTLIEKPVLFVGESGTAKTVTIQNFLNKLEVDKFNVLNINFSSRTNSKDVQNIIESNVDKRSGSTYGPPVGKKLVCFVDDLNMPKVDKYGTQQPIALLHFLVSRGNMYDRGKELNLRTFKDLMFMTAMGPPGGGRNSVDPRFVALFCTFNLTPPTLDVLTKIYGSIVTSFSLAFSDDVKSACSKMTGATLDLYNTIVEKLPPTPAKFHYIFNLRDLGRVYEGVLLASPNLFNTGASIVRLWRNEAMRILSDRLINEADVNIVNGIISGIVKKNYGAESDAVLQDPLLYGDYLLSAQRCSGSLGDKPDPRLYKDLGSFIDIRKILDSVLESYNSERKAMTLVLFESALEHLTRLLRIIKVPRGNALLVGVGGSGKQSITKLAAFAAGYKTFEITLVRGYSEVEFREDIKSLYKLLAQGPVVFLFTDAHVIEEGFLELMNNMLTTGMVPALYEKDEIDGIVNSVRKEVKEAGLIDSKEACWGYFVNKARNNMHIVLAMSPSGDTLRRRCRNFPGLVSATVIDWFFAWPEDALEKVAEFFLREETLPEEKRAGILLHMVHVHTSVVNESKRFAAELRRYNYVTPKNYLDFIAGYRKQLGNQRRTISTRTRRLEGGLTKLNEAQTAVDVMTVELKDAFVVVNQKTKDVQELIASIGQSQAIADRQQADAKVKAEELGKMAAEITVESAKANKSLEAALPALEAAAAALDALNKDDITEIKAFASPPPLVMSVMMCIMALKPTGKENEAEGWKGAKAMMGDSNFLKSLKQYEKDKISGGMIKKVMGYYKDPDFNLEKLKTVSKAGAGLFAWVDAIKEYYGVAKDVEPLRKKVADMERAQATGERELEEINALLAKLSAELAVLDSQYKAASGELKELAERAELMQKRLNAASKLVAGLGSESSRWTNDVAKLNNSFTKTVGDCLLASSFLSYLGPFTFDYRKRLLEEDWVKDIESRTIPVTTPFILEELLITEATVQKWTAEGLPADTHSVYNGILTTRCSRFPLCIDPQQQAASWIKNREPELKVASFLDGDFMQPLKLAIQYGKPFLFEGVDETLDPMVDPILEQNTYYEGSQRMITIDDKPLPWDENFRLYLTSKLANPHYSPEVMGKVQIINYSVTLGGLENQLLNVVVAHERPDLEKQFADLVADMGANATLLEELEESLLRNLAASTGNILDNEELIATLESAKTKSVEISGKLAQARITKENINTTRAGYTPAAKRGSILFFAVAGLSNINAMYETSLASFLTVFRRSLSNARKAGNLEGRLKNTIASMTREVYDYTCTGIFERHKLMFSFQMTCSILDGDGALNRTELDFFLKGDVGLQAPTEPKPYSWISAAGWKDLLKLGSGLGPQVEGAPPSPFADLVADVKSNGKAWLAWYDLEAPEEAPLPGGFSEKLQPMQLLLIYRVFRPDRVYNGVKRFVMGAMGEQYVQPPVLDYARIFSQSSPSTPVVFILSPGADPQSDIQSLGIGMGFAPPTKFKFLALGQGQAPKAEELLEQGSTRGYWILLQNTHLLISWLKNLEKILLAMTKPHPDFRLWMTTDPTDAFPLGILQRSLKVVTEPPDGLKLNMRSTFAKLATDPSADDCPHPAYRPLVYTLTFLHAVLLERRKYGKIGFNVAYDFNESDYTVSRKLLNLYLAKAFVNGDEVLPWGSLRYLIGDAMYGGRVSDFFDRRILSTYLEEYLGDFLFDKNNKFFFARSGFDYDLPNVPQTAELFKYASHVEKLPLTNGPAVYGMHPNAEISYFTAATKLLWSNLIDLQPRTAGGGGGVSREEFIATIVRDIQGKIPVPEDVFNIRKRFSEGGMPSPTQIVLLQELERWNNLVTLMASSLIDLARALAGEIGMSDTLEEVGSSLFNGLVPGMWRMLCPDTQKPLGSWMGHFQGRHAQYTSWINNGEPTVMWLSGLHIPDSYLTALVQTTCRRKGWALDRSTLYTQVTTYIRAEDVHSRPEDGCLVRGLYLEGAGWDLDKRCLVRSAPKVLVVELPILQVIPVEATRLKLAGTFRTPVYVTQMRRNAMGVGLVFEADLFTNEHSSLWVLSGVSLSLNISD